MGLLGAVESATMKCEHCGGTIIRESGYGPHEVDLVCLNCGRAGEPVTVPDWLAAEIAAPHTTPRLRHSGPRFASGVRL